MNHRQGRKSSSTSLIAAHADAIRKRVYAAGILIQILTSFWRANAPKIGFPCPLRVITAWAWCSPVEPSHRLLAEGILERSLAKKASQCWMARHALKRTPSPHCAPPPALIIEQIFIAKPVEMSRTSLRGNCMWSANAPSRRSRASDFPDKHSFYIPSLSSRTIIYKGLLLAQQISEFYKELSDPDAMSALCLVHQRFQTNTFPLAAGASVSLSQPQRRNQYHPRNIN